MPGFLTLLLHGHGLGTTLAAALAAAVLLALAGGLTVRSREARPAWAAMAAALLLTTAGLWWPGTWVAMQAAGPLADDATASLVQAALALLTAASAQTAARLLRRDTQLLGLAAAAITVLPATAFTLLLWGASGGWRALVASPMLLVFGAGIAALCIAAQWPLVLADNRPPPWRALPTLMRSGAALALGLGLALGATSALPLAEGVPAAPAPWLQLLPLSLLAAAAGALLMHLNTTPTASAASQVPEGERPSQLSRLQHDVDVLTQLPTRTYFEQRLAREVGRCDAQAGRLALLFIDLDGFKPVNDTFGHSSGDLVLEQVGARLKTLARHGVVVARVGGDEFLMLVPGNPTVELVSRNATRLIERLSEPYLIEGREVTISCSIGIVFYPDNGAHTKLIARADAAMYSAKRAGGSCYAFYTPEMDADAREQFDLLRDLRKALENNELELFYQPKIDARSGQVTAAEALLRWRHPTRGLILPGTFIPVAERFGLIGAVGNWVIDRAAQQARDWREAGLRMRVAINLSAQQMRQDDIVDRIIGALDKHRIQPSLFTCEITETVAMEDTRATQNTLRRMGEAGLHLSIDDFGTGYSSLAYLRRLPAEELKIDRSFVKDVEASADARAVVDAVVKLAHALGLRVVAEGVETQRQQEILVTMGCDELQGYLFAKPMSARALLLWAMEEHSQGDAFRPSLFSETLPIR